MTLGRRFWTTALAGLLGALLLANPTEVGAGVTIEKAIMCDKTNEVEVNLGKADAFLPVTFKGEASCTCEDPELEYYWSFGDETGMSGAYVGHEYGENGAGIRWPELEVTCLNCFSSASKGDLIVTAIKGITVTHIGDISDPDNDENRGRLCFNNAYRNVSAVTEPFGVGGSNLIDWALVVGSQELLEANMASGNLDTLSEFPTSNSSWGPKTLYVQIDGSTVPGQQGELNLTGTASFLHTEMSIDVFFDETGTQNPAGNVPNWFYYWKQTSANKGTLHYDPNSAAGHCDYDAPDYTVYIGTGDHGTYHTPDVGQNAEMDLVGIDNFAWTARHEWKHHEHKVSMWGAGGYLSSKDTDADRIRDKDPDVESGIVAEDGGPFTVGSADTFTDDELVNDFERYTCFTQEGWTVGRADSEDWAYPGRQWPYPGGR